MNDMLEAPLDPDGEGDESRIYNTTGLPTCSCSQGEQT